MKNPTEVLKRELIGLKVRIVGSTNPEIIGVMGKVIDETRNTLTVEVNEAGRQRGREKMTNFIKDQCTFSFLVDEKYKKWLKVDGKLLVSRPEDRIKKRVVTRG